MLISPLFINIANDIFINLTPSTKYLSNEREKNNACIMDIIKNVLIFRFFTLTICKTNLNFRTYWYRWNGDRTYMFDLCFINRLVYVFILNLFIKYNNKYNGRYYIDL